MPKSDHRIRTKKPVNTLKKPLKADFKDLFKALGGFGLLQKCKSQVLQFIGC